MSLRILLDAAVANATAVVPEPSADAEAGESYAALGVMTLMLLLALALIIGQILERNKIDWMSEAGGALILGISVGLILIAADIDEEYSRVFEFNIRFFFIALLPPIIFDAGFNLDVTPFFRNIGAICALAFCGTAISTGVIALFMWAVGAMGASYAISFFDACVFGAIISATDPVTVLAVFGRLKADHDLNALVFGESVMNDAVAIVLYQVITGFQGKSVTLGGLAYGLWQFFYIFAGSLAIGVAFAFFAALLFKSKYFRNEHNPIEASLLIIIAYCSFYITDGLGLSGIVSIMFCGIVMAKYVRPNLAPSTNDRVGDLFRLVASLAEIFVFIYIGCALFTQREGWKSGLTWTFIVFCLAALALSRAANVWPCVAAVNAMRPPEARIPKEHKYFLWFSGLRGAMAFALAMLARERLGPAGDVVLLATFFMIVITVLVNGGASAYLLEYWQLRQTSVPRSPENPFRILDDEAYIAERGGAPGSDAPDGSMQLSVMTAAHNLGASPNGSAPSPGLGSHAGMGTKRRLDPHPSHAPRTLIKSIHDFQRSGGVITKFQEVDKVLESYLVAPTDGARRSQSVATELQPAPSPSGNADGQVSTGDAASGPATRLNGGTVRAGTGPAYLDEQ